MRVNIAYSLELEEIPAEVRKLLTECEVKLRHIHGQLNQIIDEEPLAMIGEIDKIRISLATTDLRLDDCMQVLSGYVQTVAQIPHLENEQQNSPTTEAEPVEEENGE